MINKLISFAWFYFTILTFSLVSLACKQQMSKNENKVEIEHANKAKNLVSKEICYGYYAIIRSNIKSYLISLNDKEIIEYNDLFPTNYRMPLNDIIINEGNYKLSISLKNNSKNVTSLNGYASVQIIMFEKNGRNTQFDLKEEEIFSWEKTFDTIPKKEFALDTTLIVNKKYTCNKLYINSVNLNYEYKSLSEALKTPFDIYRLEYYVDSLFSNSLLQLKNLKHLEIFSRELKTFPNFIGDLKKLESLRFMYGESLMSIPESIGKLENLRSIDFQGNKLSSIPKSIGNCKKLTVLSLSSNKISKLPNTIGDLKEMKVLLLDENDLTNFPASLSKLDKLENISIENNNLVDFPKFILNQKLLEELDLTENKINEIPSSIGSLSKLKKLLLYGNRLTEIPESIGFLNNLEMLSFSNNKLSTLPKSLQKLNNLKFLYLDGNNFSEKEKKNIKELFSDDVQIAF